VTGYLLDTTALSWYLNPLHHCHAAAASAINALPPNSPKLVAAPTLAELDYGGRLAEQVGSAYLGEFRERLEIVRQYTCLPISHHTAEEYSVLKAKLAARMQRKPHGKLPRWIEDWVDRGSAKQLQIDENDVWIAAVAKERDLTVVTGDGDFRALEAVDPDLRIVLIAP
jgi:predicted nucleic acid-binding protein